MTGRDAVRYGPSASRMPSVLLLQCPGYGASKRDGSEAISLFELISSLPKQLAGACGDEVALLGRKREGVVTSHSSTQALPRCCKMQVWLTQLRLAACVIIQASSSRCTYLCPRFSHTPRSHWSSDEVCLSSVLQRFSQQSQQLSPLSPHIRTSALFMFPS